MKLILVIFVILGFVAATTNATQAVVVSDEGPKALARAKNLDLFVKTILPSTENTEDTQRIGYRSAITVVFNRAVVPLGLEPDLGNSTVNSQLPFTLVPRGDRMPVDRLKGQFRWVTTSIARFDLLNNDWPYDLDFDVVIRSDLEAFDGVRIDSSKSDRMRQKYSTPQLRSLGLTTIAPAASAATNNSWTPYVQSAPELTPDGTLIINVAIPIDVAVARSSLSFSPSVSMNITSCRPGQTVTSTLCARPLAPLPADSQFTVSLPEGTVYHPDHGPLHSTIEAQFVSLLPFILRPIRNARKSMYQRFLIGLTHGLLANPYSDPTSPDAQSVATALQNAVSANPSIAKITVTVTSGANLEIEALDVTPGTEYTITFRGDSTVKDIYGQPFLGGAFTFTPEPYPGFVTDAASSARNSILHLPPDATSKWDLFMQDSVGSCGSGSINYARVDIPTAIKAVFGRSRYYSCIDLSASSSISSHPFQARDATSRTFTSASLHLANMFTISSVVLSYQFYASPPANRRCCQYSPRGIINRGAYTVTGLSGTETAAVVWVTSAATGTPVNNVFVKVYSSEGELAGSAYTLENGLATVTIEATYRNFDLIAVVSDLKSNMDVTVQRIPNIRQTYTTSDVRAKLISDRQVYQSGERIRLKAIIREVIPQVLVPTGVTVTLRGLWAGANKFTESLASAAVDPDYGTAEFDIPIPATAKPGRQTFQLRVQNGKYLTDHSVVLSSTRLPAASLSVTPTGSNNGVYLLDQGLPLQITTTTLTGSALAGSAVTLKWSTSTSGSLRQNFRGYGRCEYYVAQSTSYPGEALEPYRSDVHVVTNAITYTGELSVTTGSDGSVKTTLQLPADYVYKQSAMLRIQAEWFGPGGTFITQDLEVPISRTSILVTLDRSEARNVMPGVPFTVPVDVIAAKSFGSGAPASIPGASVDVSVYPVSVVGQVQYDSTTGRLSDLGNRVTGCTVRTTSSIDRCSLTTPSVGVYVVLASTTDAVSGKTVSQFIFVGKSAAMWERSPFTGYSRFLSLKLNKESYIEGETAQVTIPSVFNIAHAVISWGFPAQTKVATLNKGDNVVSFALGAECRYGCDLYVAMSVPKSNSPALPTGVTASSMYASQGLHWLSFRESIEVEGSDPELAVSVSYNQTTYTPRGTVQADITVRTGSSAGSAADADLWVVVVNKAIFNLEPTALPAGKTIAKGLRGYKGYTSAPVHNTLTTDAQRAVQAEVIKRRISYDPWVGSSARWEATGNAPYQADISDADFYANYYTSFSGYYQPECRFVTGSYGGNDVPESAPTAAPAGGGAPMPDDGGVTAQPSSTPSAGDAAGESAKSSPAAPATPDALVRTNFQNVAFYAGSLRTSSNGKVTVKFTLPDNLGTFRFRVVAVARRTASFGSHESDFIVRKPANILPVAPKFARVGDTFSLRLRVALAPNYPGQSATLQIVNRNTNVVTLTSASILQSASTGSDVTAPVNFRFNATSLGEASLIVNTYVGTSGATSGTPLDSTLIQFPVLGVALPVTLGTSFSLQATAAGVSSKEGLSLPAVIPGSGSLEVSASASHLAQVMAFSVSLLKWDVKRPQPSAYDLLSALVPLASLKQYGNPPASLVAQAEAETLRILVRLSQYTDADALYHYPPDGRRSWARSYVAVGLHFFALNVNTYLKTQNPSGPQISDALVSVWTNALKKELERIASERDAISCYLVASAQLAYGWNTEFGHPSLNTPALLDRLSTCSHHAVALSAVAFMRRGGTLASEDRIASAVRRLENDVRVQARTAYVASSAGSQYPAPMEAQAMYLELQARRAASERGSLVDRVSAFVAAGPSQRSRYWYHWDNRPLALRTMALSTWDKLTDSLSADVTLAVRSEPASLIAARIGTTGELVPVASSSTPWSALANPPADIKINATGSGLVSVALGMTFVPAQTYPRSVFHGIEIKKVIQRLNPSTMQPLPVSQSDPATNELSRGEFVRVRLLITTPDMISTSVRVEDPFPAGYEPLDPFLSTSSPASVGDGIDEGTATCSGSSYYWWCPFTSMQFGSDSVVFTANYLSAGSYELTYLAVVAIDGRFTVPSAIAEVIEQPEVSGISAAVRIGVGERITSSAPVFALSEVEMQAAVAEAEAAPTEYCGTGGEECPSSTSSARAWAAPAFSVTLVISVITVLFL